MCVAKSADRTVLPLAAFQQAKSLGVNLPIYAKKQESPYSQDSWTRLTVCKPPT